MKRGQLETDVQRFIGNEQRPTKPEERIHRQITAPTSTQHTALTTTTQFRMLCTSSMPSGTVTILSLLSGPGYAISSSGFLSSDVPDSELQASVSHTLDVK